MFRHGDVKVTNTMMSLKCNTEVQVSNLMRKGIGQGLKSLKNRLQVEIPPSGLAGVLTSKEGL